MMDEEVDVEDLEVGDYTPIPRPTACAKVCPTDLGYSDNSGDENDSLDSNSGNDSDSPAFRPVKPKLKKRCMSDKSVHQTDKQKKYKVWCSDVQESALTEDLLNCDVQKNIDRSRDVESYNYKLAYKMEEQQEHEEDNEKEQDVNTYKDVPRDPSRGLKRRYGERGNVKSRLGPRPTNGNETLVKGTPREIIGLSVTMENTNEEVASDIANKLCEEKDDLIYGLLGERDLPALLTRSERTLEEHNKHIETDGEAAVTNPPPSPATDGRENSSDGVPELSEQLSSRQLNCYEDDEFLDVSCDMDVF
ncbi:hypothetical protein C0J52_11173 [Blattella germanica]|nr:hypothetical protein C0J52_11173 [Blattella germanica]